MIYSEGDSDIEIDFGSNETEVIFQRKEKGCRYDCLVDGETVTNPFYVETLLPGWYRLRDTA